mmetsp:Transcript_9906/g.19865  ORF Transcript_9906/g.19865 Transcript_9906/m.19865 type:complete len:247 (-) Transcript_9906:241-981(-)
MSMQKRSAPRTCLRISFRFSLTFSTCSCAFPKSSSNALSMCPCVSTSSPIARAIASKRSTPSPIVPMSSSCRMSRISIWARRDCCSLLTSSCSMRTLSGPDPPDALALSAISCLKLWNVGSFTASSAPPEVPEYALMNSCLSPSTCSFKLSRISPRFRSSCCPSFDFFLLASLLWILSNSCHCAVKPLNTSRSSCCFLIFTSGAQDAASISLNSFTPALAISIFFIILYLSSINSSPLKASSAFFS